MLEDTAGKTGDKQLEESLISAAGQSTSALKILADDSSDFEAQMESITELNTASQQQNKSSIWAPHALIWTQSVDTLAGLPRLQLAPCPAGRNTGIIHACLALHLEAKIPGIPIRYSGDFLTLHAPKMVSARA